jgi:hypothetical protein
VSTPAPTRGANSIPVAARQNYIHGKVNHVAVEEAPNVVSGTFFINDTSIVALFDSEGSHSFISATYVEKHMKDRRRRSAECEWESIKILLENLAYIPKSTRRPSLLTLSKLRGYGTTIGP